MDRITYSQKFFALVGYYLYFSIENIKRNRPMNIRQKITRKEELQIQMQLNKDLISKTPASEKENQKTLPNAMCKKRGFPSTQKKLEAKTDLMKKPDMRASQTSFNSTIKNWQYVTYQRKLIVKPTLISTYYPPSCSGYDLAYCKAENAIYLYGGISCSGSFNDGIKQYFYKYCDGKWSELKYQSLYNPTPRYGHTLTCYQKDLILFGGVSEYKQKLKDRCFYTDFSAYSTTKNNWRLLQTQGMNNKARKSHSALVYNRSYIIYGGLNESQQVVDQINWVNLQCKKPRWKSFPMPGRFNMKMVLVESQNDKDFICIFGGRNQQSQIVNTMFFVPLSHCDGDLVIKEKTEVVNSIRPREIPIMAQQSQGFIILGGINENNEVVEDGWYYDSQTQTLNKIIVDIYFSDLRGAKACTMCGQKVYLMTGNGTKSKSLELQIQR